MTPSGNAYVVARDTQVHRPLPALGQPHEIWKGIQARNPGSAHREVLPRADRLTLADGRCTRSVMSGVGKGILPSIEYVHHFASGYDLGWQIDAERPDLRPSSQTVKPSVARPIR